MASRDIASDAIWTEDIAHLAARWLKRTDAPRGLDAPALAHRVLKRAEVVRRHVKLPIARMLLTPRQWETHWKAAEAEAALTAAVARLGWSVTFVRERNLTGPFIAANLPAGERSVALELAAADDLVARYRTAGLLLPFERPDATALLLAWELFEIAAEHIGHRPAEEWIDPIARHVFAQQVLGCPFCPWVAELL